MTECRNSSFTNSVFEEAWWLDVVAPNQWEEHLIERNGIVEARWPIVRKGHKVCMPLETQNIGPWIREVNGETSTQRLSRKKSLLCDLINQIDVKYWDYRLSPSVDYVLPFAWQGFRIQPMFTYVISDLEDLASVESRFSKTAKKNIRRAAKAVEVISDPDVSTLLDCMRATFRGQNRGLPFGDDLIEAIVEASFAHGSGKMFAAQDQFGNYHACSFFLYDEKRCYYLLSGSDPEFRTSGAQTLILRDAIRFAAGRSAVFDFEGSMIEGIEKFFRQFGGLPQEYYRISKMSPFDTVKEVAKPHVKKMLGYR